MEGTLPPTEREGMDALGARGAGLPLSALLGEEAMARAYYKTANHGLARIRQSANHGTICICYHPKPQAHLNITTTKTDRQPRFTPIQSRTLIPRSLPRFTPLQGRGAPSGPGWRPPTRLHQSLPGGFLCLGGRRPQRLEHGGKPRRPTRGLWAPEGHRRERGQRYGDG